MLDSRQQR